MNALAGLNNPADVGGRFRQAFDAGRLERRETETRNALSSVITNPGDQAAMGVLAQNDPRTAIQMQDRQRQQQGQADTQQRQQQQTMRQLLRQAGDNPAQAMQAAQSMGMDVSSIPQPGSPEFEPWRQQQLFIMDALEQEGDNLPSLAREVMFALPENQRDPNSPAFRQAFTAALENKYAAEYTDAQGNTRRRSIIGQQQQAPAQPQGNQAAILQAASQTGAITAQDAERVRSSLGANGQQAFESWKAENGVRVIARSGTAPDGRRVVEYQDGTIEYAAN